jgi:hypothetical protein
MTDIAGWVMAFLSIDALRLQAVPFSEEQRSQINQLRLSFPAMIHGARNTGSVS